MTDVSNISVKQNETIEANKAFSWIKLACGITSAACFGYGIRAAYSQARPFKPGEISRAQVFSGMGFATRSLAIATIITCSGYAFLVVAVTAALDVSTPLEFGAKTTNFFGSRFRIKGSETSQQFEDIFKDN